MLELAFDAASLIGFGRFGYEEILLYELVLISFFQERFGYRDIRRKINFAPQVVGNGARIDQLPACQLIDD